MSRFTGALPALIGGLVGLYLVPFPAAWKFGVLIGAALLALFLREVARERIARNPVFYAWLLEPWVLIVPAGTALAVVAAFDLTVMADADALLPLPGFSTEQKGELVKAVIGVFAVFLGALVAGDPEKADNPLWVSAQFRKTVYPLGPEREADNPQAYYAARMKSTRDNKAKGWGFGARRIRAQVLKQHPV